MRRLAAPLLVLAFAATAVAETFPPGDYSDHGRVVRTSHGSIELFDGRTCLLLLPPELQKKLEPHMGEFVRVDYTRVEQSDDLYVADPVGSPIGKIRKVTTLAKGVRSLPIAITARPLTDRVPRGDPVRVEVTLTNRTNETVTLHLRRGECHLLQDYRWALSLGSENSAAASARDTVRTDISPADSHTFTLESAWMAKPGTYDVVFTLPNTDDSYDYQSELARVTVLPAETPEEELDALRNWLTRASPTQRIVIAERLIARGDRSGVDEVLRLSADLHKHGFRSYGPVYRFLWAHAGERGETELLAQLDRLDDQDRALRVIENVYLSPRKIPLLERLLDDRRETTRAHSGWCDRPRICDITAAWLVGYTEDEMSFPENGTLAERVAAVATVLRVLRENPTRFAVLRADWK